MRTVNPAPARGPWTSHCSTSRRIPTASWPTWTPWGSSACSSMSRCGQGTAPSHVTGEILLLLFHSAGFTQPSLIAAVIAQINLTKTLFVLCVVLQGGPGSVQSLLWGHVQRRATGKSGQRRELQRQHSSWGSPLLLLNPIQHNTHLNLPFWTPKLLSDCCDGRLVYVHLPSSFYGSRKVCWCQHTRTLCRQHSSALIRRETDTLWLLNTWE